MIIGLILLFVFLFIPVFYLIWKEIFKNSRRLSGSLSRIFASFLSTVIVFIIGGSLLNSCSS